MRHISEKSFYYQCRERPHNDSHPEPTGFYSEWSIISSRAIREPSLTRSSARHPSKRPCMHQKGSVALCVVKETYVYYQKRRGLK